MVIVFAVAWPVASVRPGTTETSTPTTRLPFLAVLVPSSTSVVEAMVKVSATLPTAEMVILDAVLAVSMPNGFWIGREVI